MSELADDVASVAANITRCEINGYFTQTQDTLAVEAPLLIRLVFSLEGKSQRVTLATTMRTPGEDQHLVTGFLLGEGIITTVGDIQDVVVAHHEGHAEVTVYLREGAIVDIRFQQRLSLVNSSCGVCAKRELADIFTLPPPFDDGPTGIEEACLFSLSARLQSAQSTFTQTGGLHAAGLFDLSGKLLCIAEDVGRHNALDKLIGIVSARELVCADKVLLLSGRVSYELVQKAIAAGVRVVAAIGAPSSLALEMATRMNMTLIGFLRKHRCNVYTGEHRIRSSAMHNASTATEFGE